MSDSRSDAPKGGERIRIGVIDDHPLMCEGIAHALEREAGLDVVALGDSADAAISIARRLLPDIMLLDVNMPGGGGLMAIREIERHCPAVSCILFTVREDVDTVRQALRSGARGYILKGLNGHALAQAIRAVNDGERFISPSLAARLLEAGADTDGDAAARIAGLTERELQILRLIATGMINKQIGGSLELSEKTIKHYVTSILQKLQVRNRVEAATMAQRHLR